MTIYETLTIIMIFGPGIGIICGFFFGRAYQIKKDCIEKLYQNGKIE